MAAAGGMKTPRSSSATWSSGSCASRPTPRNCWTGWTSSDGWPEKVRTMQRNWIGRSKGTEVDFSSGRIVGLEEHGFLGRQMCDPRLHDAHRHDLRGDERAACARASAGHALCVGRCRAEGDRLTGCSEEQKKAREAGDVGAIEKHGVPTGQFAMNPYNGERVPIWVANYMLMDYGTGAIMSVPAHDERDFEFATKYGIEIRQVIKPVHEFEGAESCHSFRKTACWSTPASTTGRRALRPQNSTPEGCRAAGIWRGEGDLSLEGLGRKPAALLGHADPHDSLRARRPRSGARRPVAGDFAGEDRDHAAGRLAAWRACRSLSTSRVPSAAARRAARPTRWIPSSIRAGISTATPTRRTRRAVRFGHRRSTGSPSTSTSAAWSTPFCT